MKGFSKMRLLPLALLAVLFSFPASADEVFQPSPYIPPEPPLSCDALGECSVISEIQGTIDSLDPSAFEPHVPSPEYIFEGDLVDTVDPETGNVTVSYEDDDSALQDAINANAAAIAAFEDTVDVSTMADNGDGTYTHTAGGVSTTITTGGDDTTANGVAALNGTDLEITFDDGGSATVDLDCAYPAFDNLRRAGDDIIYDLCDGDIEREFYSFRNAGINWTAGAFETAPTGEYLLGSQAVQFNNRSAADVRVFCTMTTGVEFLPGTSGIKYVVSLYENGTEVAGNGGSGIDQTDGNATQHVRDVTHSGTWTWLMPPGISLVEVFAEFDEQAAGLPTIWAGGARISTGGVVCVWNYGGEI